MSKNYKSCFFKVLILIGFFTNYSCGDMESIHEDYLQGEQVYAGKLDTLKIRPGYYRAQLEGQTQFLGNSNQIIIEYDEQTDVYEINPENIENGIYTMILPNLDEKSYEFNVTTQDELGNLSVSQTVAGSSVGDIFVLDQGPRELVDFTFEDDGMYANFIGNAQSENVIFTVLDYENELDEISRDTLFFEDNRKKLHQNKPNGNIITTSVIQSGLNGIDSIALEPLNYIMPELPYTLLNKNYIRLVGMPSDNTGTFNNANPYEYLFDNNSDWNGDDTFTFNSGPNSNPSHFTVDLGVMTDLRRIDFNFIDPNIDSSNNPTLIQVWGRDNINFAETNSSNENDFINAGWVLLTEQEIMGSETDNSSIIFPSSSSQKRFIRIRTVSSVGGEGVKYTELTFYGQNISAVNLDKSEFSLLNLVSDNPGTFYGAQPQDYLFDNNTLNSGNTYGYHSGENALPGHFTIDLGISTYLSDVELDFRPSWSSFNNNTPTHLEIWGRLDLINSETFPEFESFENSVVSEPVTTETFENAQWVLLKSFTLNGENNSSIEFEIDNLVKSRFIRIRYLDTVGGSACQFIEIGFSGFGIFPID
tara:strand:+ start:62 stop:1828 length:1767 start_codon:yes stop_codon:yes gene_type:complete